MSFESCRLLLESRRSGVNDAEASPSALTSFPSTMDSDTADVSSIAGDFLSVTSSVSISKSNSSPLFGSCCCFSAFSATSDGLSATSFDTVSMSRTNSSSLVWVIVSSGLSCWGSF